MTYSQQVLKRLKALLSTVLVRMAVFGADFELRHDLVGRGGGVAAQEAVVVFIGIGLVAQDTVHVHP